MRKLNKISQVEDWIPTLLAIIFLVIVILFWVKIRTDKEAEKEYISQSIREGIDANRNPLEFLQKGTKNEGENMADLIVKSYTTNNYDELDAFARKFFEPLYEKSSWKIKIILMPDDKEKKELGSINMESCKAAKSCVVMQVASSYIPLHESGKYLKIAFYRMVFVQPYPTPYY